MKVSLIEKGKWHNYLQVSELHKINGENLLVSFKLKENPSGCGSYILHDWKSTTCQEIENIVKTLEKFKEKLKKRQLKPDNANHSYFTSDIGMIQTVVGSTYVDNPFSKALLEVGFKDIISYKNPRHNNKLQHLYLWKKI